MTMEMEFRSGVDDAWYAVKIYTEDNSAERLTVKFCNFEDEYDEVYEAKDLTSANHMTNFLSRFRLVSIQVQDSECPNVVEGMLVCAAVSVTPDNCRFYDAVVNRVKCKKHRSVEGEEECLCKFVLFWKHWPKGGSLTTQAVRDICRVQPRTEEVDPLLALFLQTTRSRIQTNESSLVPLATSSTVPHEASSKGL
ncbi:putative SAWADEE domain-containing protein [Rosa chinensis]|uniref:Putative SAWADEE domain-containing protein n=1 Tax=Rosa chinensis TaxID=74649 RepID=A0A2P6RVJ6_ROSCH|nr:putative SAWADEE domain-containing protein [Rosa chinensis]